MHRLLALAGVLTLGCASQPIPQGPQHASMPTAQTVAAEAASVDAGPPPCDQLHARIAGYESQLSAGSHTWLAAPARMVETRRLRTLRARADVLGCASPRI